MDSWRYSLLWIRSFCDESAVFRFSGYCPHPRWQARDAGNCIKAGLFDPNRSLDFGGDCPLEPCSMLLACP